MKYLHIPAEDSPFSTDKEPTEEHYQLVEYEDLMIFRWNESLKCFETISCESQSDSDEEDEVTWSVIWEKL